MGLLIDKEKEKTVITLRAQGLSFASIAREAGVAKQTAVDICRRNDEAIAQLRAYEIEQLYEEQKITHEERIKAHSSMMRRLRSEIEGRDLKDISTDKLIDLYLKTASALKEEMLSPCFKSTREIEAEKAEREMLDSITSLT